jgi:hypothetical protein
MGSGDAVTSVFCAADSNSIIATIKMSSTIGYGSAISFYITNIINPPTNCSTSDFTGISIYDSTGALMNDLQGTNPYMSATTIIGGSATLV